MNLNVYFDATTNFTNLNLNGTVNLRPSLTIAIEIQLY